MLERVVANNGTNVVRRIATSFACRKLDTERRTKLNSVVKEAERIVGYSTSFLSLRWILNDEIANTARHVKKLVGTNHPLLKVARSLLLGNEQATWGLIILLMAKAAGQNSHFSELEWDATANILHSQRILAEVVEMVKTANFIQRGIVNIQRGDEHASDLAFGNKLALLGGDYLLSTSFHEVALLKNSEVHETISTALRDLSEAEFIGLRDLQNQPIPSRPLSMQNNVAVPLDLSTTAFKLENIMGNMKAEWTLRNILGGASLLARGCQCALILGKHGCDVQESGYKFGRNLVLAWQANLEQDLIEEERFSLVAAPVMFHIEHDPELYKEIEKGLSTVTDVDFDLIRRHVKAGPGLERTRQLQEEFARNALDALGEFPESDSKTALVNIVKSI